MLESLSLERGKYFGMLESLSLERGQYDGC